MRAVPSLLALLGARSALRAVGLVVPFTLAGVLSTSCDILDPPALEVEVAVDPLRFAVGDSSEVTVTVFNRTIHHVRVSGLGGCLIRFLVSDSAGTFIPMQYCQTILVYEDIGPREHLVRGFAWRGETFGPSQLLPPGSYRVFGYLDAEEQEIRSAPVDVELF